MSCLQWRTDNYHGKLKKMKMVNTVLAVVPIEKHYWKFAVKEHLIKFLSQISVTVSPSQSVHLKDRFACPQNCRLMTFNHIFIFTGVHSQPINFLLKCAHPHYKIVQSKYTSKI